MKSCYVKYEEKISQIFGRYGRFLERHPVKIIVISLTINCVLGLGMLRLDVESSAEVLYTPENSQASKDRSFLEDIYPSSPTYFYSHKLLRLNNPEVRVLILTKSRGNMLTQTFLDDVIAVDNHIRNTISFILSGTTYKLSNVCAVQNNACVVSGDVFLSNTFQQMMLINNITYPVFDGQSLSSSLASATSSNGILTSAIGVKLTYYLRENTTAQSLSNSFEEAFISQINNVALNVSEMAYTYSTGLDDELERNTGGDVVFFALTITLMMTYASLATSRMNCNFIADRSLIGQAGVLAAVLSILASFGFVSLIGVKFVNIVGVMPFLIIGIGIDDMFILMSGMADADPLTKPEVTISDRIYFMMKTSGIAITITSITDFLAFVVGASSVFISVRNFCVYTGMAVFFCYFNQITFFSACIVINEKRIKDNRHCMTCIKTKDKESLKTDKKSKCYTSVCSGYVPEGREDVDSPLERYPKLLFQKLIKYLAYKIIILVIFALYVGFAIYGVVHLKQGLLLSNLVLKDSFFYKYSKWMEDYFTSEVIMSFPVTSTVTYSSASTREIITSVLTKAKLDSEIDDSFEFNWLTAYSLSASYDTSSESAFISGLETFLQANPFYYDDVIINSAKTAITSSRFYLKTENIKSTYDQGQMMLRMREITDNAAVNMLVYSPPFIFFEQFVQILPSTLLTVGIAIIAIVIVTIIFMPHPTLVVMVGMTLFSILLGVFGYMFYWDISLSSITMIHLVMTVGFSVDFSAHICHAFLAVDGDNRADKVHLAFDRSGGPIVNGAFSTLIGISILGAASGYIFQTFGKVMFLVIFFGLAHALLLLPVILSFFGPLPKKQSETSHDQRENGVKPVSANSCSLTDNIDMNNSLGKLNKYQSPNNIVVNQVPTKIPSTNAVAPVTMLTESTLHG